MSLLHDTWNFWTQAGWFAYPLLMLFFFTWGGMINLFFKLRQANFRSTYFQHGLRQKLDQGDSHNNVREWLLTHQGIIPDVASYVFEGKDKEQFDRRFEEALAGELKPIRKEFSLLAVLVKCAPLMGLLGTISGIVEVFYQFDSLGGIELMSAGIAQALFTTKLGLFIAIPGVFAISFLKQRYKKIYFDLLGVRCYLKRLAMEVP
ncbi:MAG: MotA/TolQ/ExbB proton channel family protein [Lentisphaeria bacterium]|nr:MotA/TolQ/ExbB proton channel family protein [Lentisphaeria bacterium]